jgi:hypothetical protein
MTSADGGRPKHPGLAELGRYPLLSALAERRTPRVSRGTSVPAGPLTHHSANAPAPLSELEEAVLIVTTGLTGVMMHDGRWTCRAAARSWAHRCCRHRHAQPPVRTIPRRRPFFSSTTRVCGSLRSRRPARPCRCSRIFRRDGATGRNPTGWGPPPPCGGRSTQSASSTVLPRVE